MEFRNIHSFTESFWVWNFKAKKINYSMEWFGTFNIPSMLKHANFDENGKKGDIIWADVLYWICGEFFDDVDPFKWNGASKWVCTNNDFPFRGKLQVNFPSELNVPNWCRECIPKYAVFSPKCSKFITLSNAKLLKSKKRGAENFNIWNENKEINVLPSSD